MSTDYKPESKEYGVLKEGHPMFKKILVATDGSENSRRALMTSIECAKCFQADILLLFVFSQPLYFGKFTTSKFAEFTDAQIEEISKRVFEATLKGIDTQGIKLSKKVAKGHAATKIVEEAEKGFDFIVMGCRGHGTISGMVTGSTTQKVLALSACPIMVVK